MFLRPFGSPFRNSYMSPCPANSLSLSLSLSGSAHLVLVLAGVAVPRRPRRPVLEHLLVRTTTIIIIIIIIIIACGSRREEQQRIAEHAGLEPSVVRTFFWGLHRSRAKLHLRPKKMGLKTSICKYISHTAAVYAVSLEVVDVVVVVVASKMGTQRTYIYIYIVATKTLAGSIATTTKHTARLHPERKTTPAPARFRHLKGLGRAAVHLRVDLGVFALQLGHDGRQSALHVLPHLPQRAVLVGRRRGVSVATSLPRSCRTWARADVEGGEGGLATTGDMGGMGAHSSRYVRCT